MRVGAALALALLLAACSAAQVGSAFRSGCRAAPNDCSDASALPATRTPGM
jgi:hypothetical protein